PRPPTRRRAAPRPPGGNRGSGATSGAGGSNGGSGDSSGAGGNNGGSGDSSGGGNSGSGDSSGAGGNNGGSGDSSNSGNGSSTANSSNSGNASNANSNADLNGGSAGGGNNGGNADGSAGNGQAGGNIDGITIGDAATPTSNIAMEILGALNGGTAQTANVAADMTEIGEQSVPLAAAPIAAKWALANLVFALMCLSMAISAIFVLGGKSEDAQERRTAILKALCIVAGALAPIMFLLTEDMSKLVTVFDSWTLAMAAIFVVQAAIFTVALSDKKQAELTEANPSVI
ncbi:MAG: hypothetical protein LBS32_08515, partial [Clostridiales Family XIII bacterium]|nr:hypothetical protein [Clostridiales Family XIII bacterium]